MTILRQIKNKLGSQNKMINILRINSYEKRKRGEEIKILHIFLKETIHRSKIQQSLLSQIKIEPL